MSSCKGLCRKRDCFMVWHKIDRHATSNGERYNMLAMTAAHRTLPLPTYVKSLICRMDARSLYGSMTAALLFTTTADRSFLCRRPKTRHDRAWHCQSRSARNWSAWTHRTIASRFLACKKFCSNLIHWIRLGPDPSPKSRPAVFIFRLVHSKSCFCWKIKTKTRPSFSLACFYCQAIWQTGTVSRCEIGPIQDAVTAQKIRQQIGLAGNAGDIHIIHRTLEGLNMISIFIIRNRHYPCIFFRHWHSRSRSLSGSTFCESRRASFFAWIWPRSFFTPRLKKALNMHFPWSLGRLCEITGNRKFATKRKETCIWLSAVLEKIHDHCGWTLV